MKITIDIYNMAQIDLLNTYKFYKGLPHQDKAIAFLQTQLTPVKLDEFAKIWRSDPDNPSKVWENEIPPPSATPPVTTKVPSAFSPAPVTSTPIQNAQPKSLAQKILEYCDRKGWKLSKQSGHKNIVYIEGMNPDGSLNDDRMNVWNDLRMVLEVVDGVPKIIGQWVATTEPGRWYTQRPLNVGGAARIDFGQYPSWQIGTHGRADPHEALIQTGGPVKIFRDLNRDGSRVGDKLFRGHFGINNHWGGDSPMSDIGKWSAGCLVGRERAGHRDFMRIIKEDSRYDPRTNRGFVFTATVLAGDDLLKF